MFTITRRIPSRVILVLWDLQRLRSGWFPGEKSFCFVHAAFSPSLTFNFEYNLTLIEISTKWSLSLDLPV
ncbi:unnamed protein product, partial [Amoebophrya sp. A120]|eukprot:GSA120T00020754001.1